MAIYSIEEIRKVQNKPFSFFTLSSSEFSLLLQMIIMSGLVGILIQFIANLIQDTPGNFLMVITLIGTILSLILIKVINKIFGKGVIFFLMGDLKGFKKSFTKTKEKEQKIYKTIER